MNNVKIIVLAACMVFALGGCTRLMKGPGIVTLEQAIEAQQKNPEQAIVFATIEDAREESTFTQGVKAFMLGQQSTNAGITFAGSPYDIKSTALKKFHEDSARLNQNRSGDVRTLALGGFSLYESRNWALVQPAKYAVHTMQSADAHVADMRGWGRQDGRAYMVFDVNAGDVLYLGHIRTRWDNGQNIGVTVEDRFEELRATLPVELQGKVQKRLIKAPVQILAEELKELPKPQPKYIMVPTYR